MSVKASVIVDRINQAYTINNNTVGAQTIQSGAGTKTENLRTQTRRSNLSQTTSRNSALADTAEISNLARQRFEAGEEAVSETTAQSDSLQSYAGLRREQKSSVEFIVWQRSDQDKSYMAEKLAGKSANAEDVAAQESWTIERMVTLLYFSGSRTQRVSFSHYQPDVTMAGSAYHGYSRRSIDTGQPAFYQTVV